jgi:excisionase family DNA binding protein
MDKETEKKVLTPVSIAQLDFYTLEQLAERLGTTTRHLQNKIGEGKLKASKIGKRLIVTNSDVLDFIKASQVNEVIETPIKTKVGTPKKTK